MFTTPLSDFKWMMWLVSVLMRNTTAPKAAKGKAQTPQQHTTQTNRTAVVFLAAGALRRVTFTVDSSPSHRRREFTESTEMKKKEEEGRGRKRRGKVNQITL